MEQPTKNNSNSHIGLILLTLVIGLVLGFGISKISDNHAKNDLKNQLSAAQVPTSDTKAADLRANLVTLGVEHMSLTDQAVDGALDGSPNASATAASLYTNGTNIGAAVGSVYGPSAEATFNSVWKLHLDQFVAYAVASSKGDETGKTAALNAISTGYTKPLAQYLAKANPNIDEANLEAALADHVSMTAHIIDDHVQKNYTAEASDLMAANKHIEGIFSILAGAIVKQYPAKF